MAYLDIVLTDHNCLVKIHDFFQFGMHSEKDCQHLYFGYGNMTNE